MTHVISFTTGRFDINADDPVAAPIERMVRADGRIHQVSVTQE
jgi:hypothetical protein